MLRPIVKKIKSAVKYLLLSNLLNSRQFCTAHDFVYQIDIAERGRFLNYLLLCLGRTGRLIEIPLDMWSSDLICMIKHCGLPVMPFRPVDKKYVLVSDKEEGGIFIDYDYFGTSTPTNGFYLPYFMHPSSYVLLDEKTESLSENTNRPIKIFFAGSSLPVYKECLKFAMLDRWSILELIQKNFNHIVKYDKSFCGNVDILLAITTSSVNSFLKYDLGFMKYLSLCSKSRFFLCPPGLSMPMSHNLIECMYAGAIPITNYADYLHPKLTHMENCLCFNAQKDLCEIIQIALDMSEDCSNVMRKNVQKFYREHLSPEGQAQRILKHTTPYTMYVNNENCSVLLGLK